MEVVSGRLIVSLHVSHSQCKLVLSNKFAILCLKLHVTCHFPVTVCIQVTALHKSHGFESIRILLKNPSEIFYETISLCLVFTKGLWQCCVLHLQLDLPRIAAIYS